MSRLRMLQFCLVFVKRVSGSVCMWPDPASQPFMQVHVGCRTCFFPGRLCRGNPIVFDNVWALFSNLYFTRFRKTCEMCIASKSCIMYNRSVARVGFLVCCDGCSGIICSQLASLMMY
ncbi:hypothetical protein F5Y16DRAFT_391699 [Xylariaceae sp. FL0255]|nr:hypothetical protein F5Y16DRAFT_391699 [Xylariaceae sp. FL0255]